MAASRVVRPVRAIAHAVPSGVARDEPSAGVKDVTSTPACAAALHGQQSAPAEGYRLEMPVTSTPRAEIVRSLANAAPCAAGSVPACLTEEPEFAPSLLQACLLAVAHGLLWVQRPLLFRRMKPDQLA